MLDCVEWHFEAAGGKTERAIPARSALGETNGRHEDLTRLHDWRGRLKPSCLRRSYRDWAGGNGCEGKARPLVA